MGNRAVNWVSYIGLLALFGAALLGGFGWMVARTQAQVREWPQVPGKILTSTVELKPTKSTTLGSGGSLHLYWTLDVRYSYRVGARDYVGDRITTRRIMSSTEGGKVPPKWLLERKDDFVPGRMISVYYQPSNPARSVLEHDRTTTRRLFIVALALALTGIAILLIQRVGKI